MIATRLSRAPGIEDRPLPEFVPVIFANGVDDDLMGFEAAVKNLDFQYEERIYREGEPLHIQGRSLYFSVPGLLITGHQWHYERGMPVPGWYVIRQRERVRPITLKDCVLLFKG